MAMFHMIIMFKISSGLSTIIKIVVGILSKDFKTHNFNVLQFKTILTNIVVDFKNVHIKNPSHLDYSS